MEKVVDSTGQDQISSEGPAGPDPVTGLSPQNLIDKTQQGATSISSTNNTKRCFELAAEFLKHCPPTMNLVEYMEFGEAFMDGPKQDKLVEKITKPFKPFQKRPSKYEIHVPFKTPTKTGYKTAYINEDVAAHIIPDDCLGTENGTRLSLLTKLKVHMAYAMLEDKTPLLEVRDAALGSMKVLSDGIINILEWNRNSELTKEARKLILAAAICIHEVYYECKKAHQFTVSNAGLDILFQYLVDILCKSECCDSGFALHRCQLVAKVFAIFDYEDFEHYILELLIKAVKASLNRIYRVIKKNGNSGIIGMNEVDILFRYFRLMSQMVYMLWKLISVPEVLALKGIERTSFTAIPYPLIGYKAARIAAIAQSYCEDYNDYAPMKKAKQNN